jgi:rod shape-determining protein MreD
MESTEVYIGPEPHIEVHKYYAGVVPIVVLLALVLQAFFPVYIRSANYLELPLLVTLYFALSKRNPSSGLMLGMIVGLLQDSLSRTPLGGLMWSIRSRVSCSLSVFTCSITRYLR